VLLPSSPERRDRNGVETVAERNARGAAEKNHTFDETVAEPVAEKAEVAGRRSADDSPERGVEADPNGNHDNNPGLG